MWTPSLKVPTDKNDHNALQNGVGQPQISIKFDIAPINQIFFCTFARRVGKRKHNLTARANRLEEKSNKGELEKTRIFQRTCMAAIKLRIIALPV